MERREIEEEAEKYERNRISWKGGDKLRKNRLGRETVMEGEERRVEGGGRKER